MNETIQRILHMYTSKHNLISKQRAIHFLPKRILQNLLLFWQVIQQGNSKDFNNKNYLQSINYYETHIIEDDILCWAGWMSEVTLNPK